MKKPTRWTFLRGIPADSADCHEKILIWVSLGMTYGACPLMEVTRYDRSCDFPTKRRRQPQIGRHRYEIKIKISPRRRRQRRPEGKRHVPSVLQLIECAAGQSQYLKKFISRQRLHPFHLTTYLILRIALKRYKEEDQGGHLVEAARRPRGAGAGPEGFRPRHGLHEPQDNREERAVDFVWLLGEQLVQIPG